MTSSNVSSWLKKIELLLTCLLILVSGILGDGHTYLNHFAVHIPGGHHVAKRVAETHGYTFKGQIGSLEDHYLFEHPHVHRRSASHSEHHHRQLSDHPEVHWFEQQKIVNRKKRDFIEMPDSMAMVELTRKQRDVKQDLYFNDELYEQMWYFHGGGQNHTDMNVMGAWKRGVTGKNVVITILDDGIERNHDDLKDNYDPYASFDVNGHDPDPMPRYDFSNENRHGTRCAGEVSAKANNTKCVVGVAYDSKIGGVRMLDGDVYDAVEAASLSHNRSHIDIYSASWGPDDDGRVVDGPGVLAKKAFTDGVKLGRLGKGSIFVWASGNGGNQKDSCNCDGYTNSIYTLSISSISQNGRRPWYLEECSSTLATTYSSGTYSESQIVTVDLHNKCTTMHTGTSASAPLAAGIVALILEVNPTLTWRDVQYITLMTSRPLPDGEWVTNGVNRRVSLRYGYGLMDATAMVELAEKWTNVPAQHICEEHSQAVNKDTGKMKFIPDEGYSETLYTSACADQTNAINYLEHVQARMTIKSKRRGDLVIHLTSPSGTRSTILPHRPNDSDRMKGFQDWAFLSVHFWGENPVGEWKLEIEVQSSRSYVSGGYAGAQTTNDLIDWTLVMYGTEQNPVNLVQPTHSTQPPAPIPSAGTSQPTPKSTTTTSTTAPPSTSQPIMTTTVEACHPQCLGECSGPAATQCEACRAYKIQETSECVQSCPNEYYADEFTCKKCDSRCETCTHISAKQIMCLKCKPGFLLVEGKSTCEPFCGKGYYKDEGALHCRVCSGLCGECKDSPNKCTACREGFELQGTICNAPSKPCPSGQYMSPSGCVSCPEGCYSCHSNSNCTCCNNGIYLQNGFCVSSCDNGYLPFHVNYSSKFVFQQCQQCGNECNVCPEGFKFSQGVCIQESNCPDGHYFEWNDKKCQSCNKSCKLCLGPSLMDCFSCYPPFGYSSTQRKCVPCCSSQPAGKGEDCCQCIEEGKCEVSTNIIEQKKTDVFGFTNVVIAVLLVMILGILVFIAVTAYLCYKRRVEYGNYSYGKLQQDDVEVS